MSIDHWLHQSELLKLSTQQDEGRRLQFLLTELHHPGLLVTFRPVERDRVYSPREMAVGWCELALLNPLALTDDLARRDALVRFKEAWLRDRLRLNLTFDLLLRMEWHPGGRLICQL